MVLYGEESAPAAWEAVFSFNTKVLGAHVVPLSRPTRFLFSIPRCTVAKENGLHYSSKFTNLPPCHELKA